MINMERENQRVIRMKLNANKFIRLLAKFPKHEKNPLWTKRLQDLVAGITVSEHMSAAARIAGHMEKPGVNIRVPVKQFKVEITEPVVE